MKEMRSPNPAEGAQRSSQVLMIPRRHDAAAALAKARDALAIGNTETVAQVDGKQPQLIKVCRVERTEDWVVALSVSLAIASYHFAQGFAGRVFLRSQFVPQQREATDVPIVGFEGNRRLH